MRTLVLMPGNDVGGAERAASQVAAALQHRGHDVLVGAPDPSALPFGLDAFPSRALAVDPGRKWLAPRGVVQIRQAEADVVYSHHRWPTLLAGIARRIGGPPVVCHAQTKVGRRYGTWWGDQTIAVSEAMREHVLRSGGHGDRITVVYNGALPRSRPLRRGHEVPRLVTAARLVEGKGIEHLVRAVPALAGVHLTVLGDGPVKPALVQLASTLRVADRVRFTGWVDDPFSAYSHADVGVVPTDTYPEGLPLVAAEMLMAGLPVVVSDVPGLREVADSDTALLVPPADPGAIVDAVRTLLMRREETDLGRRAHARAMHDFNAERSAMQVAAIIESAASPIPR